MVTGNNEFQRPGDKGSRDAGDQSAGHMQHETQNRDLASTSYDSAKATFANLTKDGLMSLGDDPKGFQEKTAALLAQSPEGIKATIAKNEVTAEAVRTFMQCIDTKITNVLNAQKVQEAFERANRTA